MDSTHEKEQITVGVVPETILSEEIKMEGDVLPTTHLDTPLPWYKNQKLLIALGIAVVLLIGAGYYAYVMYTTGGSVATVNGKKISQNEFNESVTLIEQNATLQGIDLTQESARKEIETQALEALINNALLITAAEKAGFEVTGEDIQVKYDELAEQLGGADILATKMVEVGLTEEKLRSNIADRILSDLYIESVTTIEELTVSTEEVNEFIKTINVGEAELPPLEEIRPQIESQILGQKRQQIVTDLLAKLRSEATIETKI